eukprot:53667-Eustigmatos_ZCMA.PRE.1
MVVKDHSGGSHGGRNKLCLNSVHIDRSRHRKPEMQDFTQRPQGGARRTCEMTWLSVIRPEGIG